MLASEHWQGLSSGSDSRTDFAFPAPASFSEAYLTELLKTAKVTPAANQVELHAWLPQHDLVKFCQDKGITVQASPSYSVRGKAVADSLS